MLLTPSLPDESLCCGQVLYFNLGTGERVTQETAKDRIAVISGVVSKLLAMASNLRVLAMASNLLAMLTQA